MCLAFKYRPWKSQQYPQHDDVIKWKHFPHYWPFVRGLHLSQVNSPHKGQWRGALMFSLICVWINDWVNNREAGDLRHYRAHYVVVVMNLHILLANYILLTNVRDQLQIYHRCSRVFFFFFGKPWVTDYRSVNQWIGNQCSASLIFTEIWPSSIYSQNQLAYLPQLKHY